MRPHSSLRGTTEYVRISSRSVRDGSKGREGGLTKSTFTSFGILVQQLDDHRVERHETRVFAKVILGLAEEAVFPAVATPH
jgi:hypothetical protein